MRRYLLVLIALIFTATVTLYSADDATVASIIRNAPDAKAYPQAGALILLDELHITLNPDGSVVKEGHKLIKILQDRARDQMSDQKVKFNGKTQKCVILRAVTHLANGRTQSPEKDGIMEVSDPESANAPFYSNARLEVISFPGVDMGAVLELKYRVEPLEKATKKKKDFFAGEVLFGGSEPILMKRLSLTLPENHPLHTKLFNSEKHPVKIPEGKTMTYTWTFKDQPQIIREFSTVPNGDLVPRLVYSGAKDYAVVGRTLSKDFVKKSKPDKAVKAKAKALIKGIDDPAKRADALAAFIIKKIRNVHLALGRVGYTPTEAGIILSNAYADVRDKYTLFAAMARVAGLKTEPLFVHTDHTPLADVAALDQFDDLLAKVTLPDGSERYYALTRNRLKYGILPASDAGRKALLIARSGGTIVTTPAEDEKVNSCKAEWKMDLDSDGNVKGTLTVHYDGSYDGQMRSRFYSQTKEEMDIAMQNLVDGIKKGGHLDNYTFTPVTDLNREMALTLSFTLPGYAVLQGDVMLLTLPADFTPASYAAFGTVLPTVNYPCLVPVTAGEEATVEITLPAGFSVVYAPPSQTIDESTFDYTYSSTQEGANLTLKQKTVWHESTITPAEYTKVWKRFGATKAPRTRLLLLKR